MKKEIFLLIVFYINICYAQRRKLSVPNRQCILTTECIPMKKCTPLATLFYSKNITHRKQAARSICKLIGETAFVCCKRIKPIKETKMTTTSVKHIDGKDLLPKQCGQPASEDRIHGGQEADIGGYPWIVALGYSVHGSPTVNFGCSGSVISSRYVLTAAHCFDDEVKLISLNLGDWDLSNPEIDCQKTLLGLRCSSEPHMVVGFDDIIIHKSYNKTVQTSNDIALIRLDRNLDFKKTRTIQPVCIPPADLDISTIPNILRPIVAGWGFTEHVDELNDEKKSNILLKVAIPLVDPQQCTNRYKERFTSLQICAGGEEGFDSCGGDSGGPLVISGEHGPPFQQIGIVSFGSTKCGQKNFPAVYTSVSKYRKWIEDNLKP